jgi:hypothetical protein
LLGSRIAPATNERRIGASNATRMAQISVSRMNRHRFRATAVLLLAAIVTAAHPLTPPALDSREIKPYVIRVGPQWLVTTIAEAASRKSPELRRETISAMSPSEQVGSDDPRCGRPGPDHR